MTFRVVAPAATSVQLRPPGGSLGSEPVDLVRETDGEHWSATVGPVPPGFYYYWLTVDGTDMNDPGTQTYIGHGRAVSGLEVPDPANHVVERHDIPRGEVRHRWYLAETTGTWRRLVVYTPPGYDDDPSARYPVLYLQHGAGRTRPAGPPGPDRRHPRQPDRRRERRADDRRHGDGLRHAAGAGCAENG